MEKKASKMGRPTSAREPAMYKGVTKTCPFCSSTDAEFKFLNNKSMEQPRYKCLGCTKLFTHNPNSSRKKHPQGYSKIAAKRSGSSNNNDDGATVPELPNNATVSCLNPMCGEVGTSKFLFFNNGKLTQPRYKCGNCNTTFTHGGRLSSKRRNFDEDNTLMQGVAGLCAEQLLSLKRKFGDGTMDLGEQCGTTARPKVLGKCNKKVKLASRKRRGEEEELDEDSSDEDSEMDEDEMAWLDEMARLDILRHMNVEKNQDSDSDSDEDEEEEPSEFVETLKLCNWCKSPNTEFCKTLKDSGLLEYQCQDCCAHLKFDGATQTVRPIERQSRNTKYNLRCTRNLVESE
jgi:transposase-like protein